LGVFRRKDGFGFSSFCSRSKFGGGGEAGNYRRSHGDKVGTASDDSVKGSVFTSPVDIGGFFLPLVKFEEAGVSDCVYIDMVRRVCRGSEEGVVSFVVDFMRGEEEFGFIDEFVDGEGSVSPVDDWVVARGVPE